MIPTDAWDRIQQYLARYRTVSMQTQYVWTGGIHRALYCLQLLDNPHHQYPVIHVAGTSGKGSTCQYLSDGLRSQWYKVWLTVSPHLINLTERFVIDATQISPQSLWELIDSIDRALQQTNLSLDQNLTYFEICMICAYTRFARSGVDVAVIETWLGGRYDASNVVTRRDKICVLTDIWLDHVDILGPTIADITYQKAMIMHPGQHVFVHTQDPVIDSIIDNVAISQQAFVHRLDGTQLLHIDHIADHSTFRYYDTSRHHMQVYSGDYQVRNAHLALQVIAYFQNRLESEIDYKALSHAIAQSRVFARHMSVQIAGRDVLVDGAHNPQKMSAYMKYIDTIYPQWCHMIVAFKQGKDRKSMMDSIMSRALSIGCISIGDVSHDMQTTFVDPIQVMQYALQHGMSNDNVHLIDSNLESYLTSVQGPLVITWSLYMIGQILQMYQKN